MSTTERRFTSQKQGPVALLSRDGGGEVIAGYASVYYDGSQGTEYQLWEGAVERVMPGAFDRALAEGDDCRGLFNHDPNCVLGRSASGTLRLKSDAKGLSYEIDPADTTVSADVREHLRRGDVNGSSFSFLITDQDWRTETRNEKTLDIREIRGVKLFDVGPVTYPAYEGTTAGTRSADDLSEARAAHAAWKESSKPTLSRDAISARAREIELEEEKSFLTT